MTLGDLADAVKRNVTAAQVAEHIGLQPDRKGFCKCPLHGEKTGSMKLYPGSRGWYCFGCHQGGSVIDLVMGYYGMGFKEAVEFLNAEFGLGLPIGYKPTAAQEAEAKRLAAEREEAEKRRRMREQEKDKAYQDWLDIGQEIRRLEFQAADFRPNGRDDPFPAEYVAAMQKLPELRSEAERLALVCFGKEEE